MKIACIGGGPGGLYFAISMKIRQPEADITIFERNRPDDTFGWGVVFSDQTLEILKDNDPISAQQIHDNFSHWDDIDVHIHGEVVTSTGHGFIGIGRMKLLQLLQERARELGVKMEFESQVDDLDAFQGYDVVVACDGINSRIRQSVESEFAPDIDVRKNRFTWLGTHKVFTAFTFIFEKTEHGWFWAHAYRFDENTSTFIVECSPETWSKSGLENMDSEESIALCEKIFAKYLDGHKLMSNAKHLRGSSAWLNFSRIITGKWYHKNIVLLGDAAHTAHFSIGSGTKLALEDGIVLAKTLCESSNREDAFQNYQKERELDVFRLQSAARNSTEWFEHIDRYLGFEPIQFAYSLLTRSQRVSHENLRLRDGKWLGKVEKWFAGNEANETIPPMFTPFNLRGLSLKNRLVVAPMATYSAEDGVVNDFHLVHYGSRAQGGAGLIFTEMTHISKEARITPGCTGMYKPEHVEAWKWIVNFVHQCGSKMALQIGHAGPKGSTKVLWEGMDQPLDEGNWPIVGPSAIGYSPNNQVPKELTKEELQQIRQQFVWSASRARECNFDMLELHCAHGYLLSAFLTPLMNQRTDEYGGSIENRLRFPLEVFRDVREVWPEEKPISIRISAHDWVSGGNTDDDAVVIAKAFKEAGADIIHVSAGQTSTKAKPVYGRMFQTPFSDRIRNEAGIPTIAVGNIYEVDHVNSILVAGRADLCALARPHLSNPFWTLHAAAEQGHSDVKWPIQYLSGKSQIERIYQRNTSTQKF